MLVLTRKVDERIVIGDCITLAVVRIEGNAVRIGVEAPPEMPVKRAKPNEQEPARPSPFQRDEQ